MYQQIRNTNHRITRMITDIYFNFSAILLHHHTMKCKWKCHPLILLNPTIIMCIQHCHACILIQWVLLYIKSRRINMCSQNLHALLKRLLTHQIQHQCLIHIIIIQLVTSLRRLAVRDQLFQIPIALLLRQADCLLHTLSFRLAGGNICLITFIIAHHLLHLRIIILIPCDSLQFLLLSLCFFHDCLLFYIIYSIIIKTDRY